MINIIIKPNSRKQDEEWIPEGMIIFPSGATQTEIHENYSKKFKTKEHADKYFVEMSNKRYRVKN